MFGAAQAAEGGLQGAGACSGPGGVSELSQAQVDR
jgi:hypothetical protein